MNRVIQIMIVVGLMPVAYYLTQVAIDRNRVLQYIDCVEKIDTHDWDKISGDKPSSSEVCKDIL